MRGPQVSEFMAKCMYYVMMLLCYFITAAPSKSLSSEDCWDLAIFGWSMAWLSFPGTSSFPFHSYLPSCDVLENHLSGAAAFASPCNLM